MHVRGQWGDIPEEDPLENEYSLKHGFRALEQLPNAGQRNNLVGYGVGPLCDVFAE